MPRLLLLLAALSVLVSSTHAANWPMWRHDPGRTAASTQSLPENLSLRWTRQLPAPAPAFRDTRLRFDAGYEPIVLGKRLFIASNRDDSVTAFDTETGNQLWKYFTNGPIRFAPVAGKGRLIFGSDDGCVYCLKASDGSLVWKHRAVPSQRLILGNDRLISVWPIRGGPVLQDDRVYFSAGVWPLEGTFVFCVDAVSGEVIWRNDRASYLYGVHPHNAEAYGGLAPQGYLLIDGEDLVVPSSQAYPARFDLQTGQLKSFELPAPGRIPGGWFASTPADKEDAKLRRRGLLFDNAINTKPHEDKPRSEGLPEIRSTIRTGDREWKFADPLPGVDGEIHSIVAADAKLFVTTTAGHLHCLGAPAPGKPTIFPPKTNNQPRSNTTTLPDEARVPNGYAVLLGVPDRNRIDNLLTSTQLRIVGIESSPETVHSLRHDLGTNTNRAALIEASPSTAQLPRYFAGLILVDPSTELTAAQLKSHYQSLRPYGGKIIAQSTGFATLAASADLPGAVITDSAGWTIVTREGALAGATNYTGDWDASADERVKAPLGLLWFGDSITHFKRSPQPKFIDGVMVSNPKDWTDASTREKAVDYRLLETTFSDVYTGRTLAPGEAPAIRKEHAAFDRETIQPTQYRPPHQADDWKPEAPRAGTRKNPLTGETEPRVFPKSYRCDGGVDYGHLYSMRSATPAFYDKRIESGTVNISGPRSGCTNSVIPANGILNLPFFYEGCTCAYPLPMALALVSMPETYEQWASWGDVPAESLAGKVERIGLNFGAPGDRMTEDGTLWLDLPNIGGPSPQLPVVTDPPLEKLETHYQHSLFLESGTGWPWVGGSGVIGLKSVTVQGMKPGFYHVRITHTEKGNRRRINTDDFGLVEVAPDGVLAITIKPAMASAMTICGIEIVRSSLPLAPPPRW